MKLTPLLCARLGIALIAAALVSLPASAQTVFAEGLQYPQKRKGCGAHQASQ